MTAKFARAARMFADRIEGRKTTHLAAARQMIALALKLAADPIEVLRQQIDATKHPEVKKALEEVLEKLQAHRSKPEEKPEEKPRAAAETLRDEMVRAKNPAVRAAIAAAIQQLDEAADLPRRVASDMRRAAPLGQPRAKWTPTL